LPLETMNKVFWELVLPRFVVYGHSSQSHF
jgi:hypothetical protein